MDLGDHYYCVARPLLHKGHYCFQYKHLQYRVDQSGMVHMILSPDLPYRNLGTKLVVRVMLATC